MDALQRIAKAHNLLIIEDACQPLGHGRGQAAGSFGTGCSLYH
jgi:dTDP-4-amino-4,6-dideoxygalactose transaminase